MILATESLVRQHLATHNKPFKFAELFKTLGCSRSDLRKVIEKLMRNHEIRNTKSKGQGNYGVYVKTEFFVARVEGESAWDDLAARRLFAVVLGWSKGK